MSVSIHEVAKKYSDSLDLSSSASAQVNVEYVWIKDVCPPKLSSKTRTLTQYFENSPQVEDIPTWNFNMKTNRGLHHTGYLHPAQVYKDPFRLEKNVLTLCETYLTKDEPTENTRKRMECKYEMESGDLESHECRFEIEQEFVFYEVPEINNITHKDLIRKTVESFYRACNYMGLSMSSFSIENHPEGYLSYKIGPCDGLKASDDLWMSRYVLRRVAEEFHLMPSFGFLSKSIIPKGDRDYDPYAHYSLSTKEVCDEDALCFIKSCIEQTLPKCTPNSNANDNTSDNAEGDASRNTTVNNNTELRCRGDCDPYIVTKAMVVTKAMALAAFS